MSLLTRIDSNDTLFKKILLRGLENTTIEKVELLNTSPVTKKGENYLGELTRFSLKYTCIDSNKPIPKKVEKVMSLILKEEPIANEENLEHMRKQKYFNNEKTTLEIILPRIEEIIGQSLGPKVFHTLEKPFGIIMEDLGMQGFKNINRQVGFSKSHVLLVLEKLATFHAGSVVFNEERPAYLQQFNRALVNECTRENIKKLFEQCIWSMGEDIKNWPDERFAKISEKLKKLSSGICVRLSQLFQNDDDEFCVLNHGDCWSNNIMFKENDNGDPIEARLVDYQLIGWTSPALDLLYFLNISPEYSIKYEMNEFFLKFYLQKLTSMMKNLGCKTKPPTLENIKKGMYKRRAHGVLAALICYPRMVADGADTESIDSVLDSGESKLDIFKSEICKKTMEKILPLMDAQGYFD